MASRTSAAVPASRTGAHVERSLERSGAISVASFPPVLQTNPYQRLLYEALATLGITLAGGARFDLGWLLRSRSSVRTLHFHWPQSYYRYDGELEALRLPLSYVRLVLMVTRLLAARLLGYRVVWTVHQVVPHETTSRRLDRLAARALARFSSALIALDEDTAGRARTELGRRAAAKLTVVPHGFYVDVYPEGRPASQVRAELGIPEDWSVALCFGHLRAYKDVGVLLEAFAASSLPRTALVIAGPALDRSVGQSVARAAAVDPRIVAELDFVPDERVAELFAACDVAVVPRGDGGTSGSAALALSLGRPAIVARTPGYSSLIGEGAAGWLFSPGDAADLRRTLETAMGDRAAAETKGREARRIAEALPWSEVARRTAAVLR